MTSGSNSTLTPFRLRPFRPEDLPQLVALDRRCFAPDVAYDTLEMFYHLSGPRSFALLAVSCENTPPPLLGFVIGAAGSRGRPGQIVTIDVAPEARRRGVGTRLLEAAEELLARKRTAEVRLQVAVDNDGAQTFYREHGYRSLGIHPHYYPDGTDALEMMKKLT